MAPGWPMAIFATDLDYTFFFGRSLALVSVCRWVGEPSLRVALSPRERPAATVLISRMAAYLRTEPLFDLISGLPLLDDKTC